ncbi:MAG: rod shape-determining protein MreD [Candidatus Planktophila sp.]
MSLRSFIYSAPVFLSVFLIQEGIVSQLRLPLGGFNLLLIVALIWAALSTPEIGALTGFGAGIAMDLSQSTSGPMGHWTLVLIIACYVLAFLGYGDDNIRGNPINIVFLTTIGLVAAQFLYLILGILLSQEAGSVGGILLLLGGSAFWTAIVSPLVLKVISVIHSGVFGLRSQI